uniref:EGF-like domain-containing protein n=1 Tax=Parascaris equorum TaxID=6256 RepID=A0A914RSJ5_PAREQ
MLFSRLLLPVVNECSAGLADCDPNADCIDVTNGYTCQCQNGFKDVSNDPINKPGRICAQRKCETSIFVFEGVEWDYSEVE